MLANLRSFGHQEIPSLNFTVIIALISFIIVFLNGIFISMVWNEIGNIWKEFDREIEQIKEMERLTSVDIQKFPVRLIRMTRRARRPQLRSDPRRLLTIGPDFAYLGRPLPDKFWQVKRRQFYADAVALPKGPLGQCFCSAQNHCPRGLRGPKGAAGAKGQSGKDGIDGRSGEDYSLIHQPTRRHICTYCPSGAPGLPGPTGNHGVRGPAGMNGRMGKNGARGNPGDMGPPGPSGSPGQRGVIGPPGADALVVMGIKGPKGTPGQTGPSGPIGDPGLSNAQSGRVGLPGVPGSRGAPGKPGPIGSRGYEGYAGGRGKSQRYCMCPKRFLKRIEETQPLQPIGNIYPLYTGVAPFRDGMFEALQLGAKRFEVKNSPGIFEFRRSPITSSDVEVALAKGHFPSRLISASVGESYLHQTSVALTQTTAEPDLIPSTSLASYQIFPNSAKTISFPTVYFPGTTVPSSTISAFWQKAIQQSTYPSGSSSTASVAFEATTSSGSSNTSQIPLTQQSSELNANIASSQLVTSQAEVTSNILSALSETSTGQQLTGDMRPPSVVLTSLPPQADLTDAHSDSHLSSPSVKGVTASESAPMAKTLSSFASKYLHAFWPSSILSEDSQPESEEEFFMTQDSHSEAAPPKLDKNVVSVVPNSVVLFSGRSSESHELVNTLRQVLQPSDIQKPPPHAQGLSSVLKQLSPSVEQTLDGNFDASEYDETEEEESSQVSSTGLSKSNVSEDSEKKDIAKMAMELGKLLNAWGNTAHQRLAATGIVPASDHRMKEAQKAAIPNETSLKLLEDLIKVGYSMKKRRIHRIKGGRDGLIQKMVQELLEMKKDGQFENAFAVGNDGGEKKALTRKFVPTIRAMVHRPKLSIRKMRLFPSHRKSDTLLVTSTAMQSATQRKVNMEASIVRRGPKRDTLTALHGAQKTIDYIIPASLFSKDGKSTPSLEPANLFGRL